MRSTEILLNNNLWHTKCPLCFSKELNAKGKISYSQNLCFSTLKIKLSKIPQLWVCKECSSGFTQNAIKKDDAERLYSIGNSAFRWREFKVEHQIPQNVINELNHYFKGGNILDIGAGSGSILDYAKQRLCKTYAIEISKDSREQLINKGHIIINSLSDTDDESFDIITAFDLIEHLYDVPIFMSNVQKKLRKDGHLIIQTGNIKSLSSLLTGAKWWYVSYPEHIIFPSKKYFYTIKNFKVMLYKTVFANTIHEKTFLKRFKTMFSNIITQDYRGLPSLFGDHNLIILRKLS